MSHEETECITICLFVHSNGFKTPGMKRLAEDAINGTDCSGKTALHFAAANGDLCTLKTLLRLLGSGI
jgi:hypothetical protein